ncbi:MAG: cysteine desulfurase family protein [Acidimicrobiales bacterium]
MIYLDHAATTPLRPEVAAAMAPFGDEKFGNPSGGHRMARDARRALEEARDVVAAHLGTEPAGVIFTSGGTEADNLAVFGVARGAGAVICSAVEHPAVREACRAASPGLCEAPVDAGGVLDLDAFDAVVAERPDVALVSVMAANHEVGTVQPVARVAELVRSRAPGAVVHSDAVQAAAWLDVARVTAGADLVSVSAHKLGGPKGSGALAVRHGVHLTPLLYGGGQEHGRRSGTHGVAGAVGLAAALEAVARTRAHQSVRVAALRDRLADGLVAAVPGCTESAERARTLPGHCHVCIDGIDNEELLVLLDGAGVCASGGAACSSGALEPSRVLGAMGVPPARARGAVRFTLGHTTTGADVTQTVAAVASAVDRLRG